MKLPFVEEIPTFAPRHRAGVNPNLSDFEREVLDAIDVGEQRDEFNTRIAVRAWNLSVVLAALILLINGPQALSIIQRWVGPQPSHSAAVNLSR